jgi:hypothetical protein
VVQKATQKKSKSAQPKTKKSEKAEVTVAVVEAAPVPAPSQAPQGKRVRVNQEDFMKRLTEKLSHFDANMILEAAMLTAGVEKPEGYFKKEEAREVCLALIKRGGPAFSVGTGIYRELVG